MARVTVITATDPRIGRPVVTSIRRRCCWIALASDHNLAKMATFFQDRPAKLRPHFKNHKCTTLAKRQLAADHAVGITCAKLGEAEILVGTWHQRHLDCEPGCG